MTGIASLRIFAQSTLRHVRKVESTMGIVFGKVSVEEPPFDVLLHRAGGTQGSIACAYDIRQYGARFAIEAEYEGTDDGTPFRLLAGYIGVFGQAQNEGDKKMKMTAPVVLETKNKSNSNPITIAMTAPVVKSKEVKGKSGGGGKRKMQFVLPAEYDDLPKIPKPMDSRVRILEVPPSVGAVHSFTGASGEEKTNGIAKALAKQLEADGIEMSQEAALQNYQFWGYNPPFTIPIARRNEVWIELTEEQSTHLTNLFGEKQQLN